LQYLSAIKQDLVIFRIDLINALIYKLDSGRNKISLGFDHILFVIDPEWYEKESGLVIMCLID
jgi:hypothetical protein